MSAEAENWSTESRLRRTQRLATAGSSDLAPEAAEPVPPEPQPEPQPEPEPEPEPEPLDAACAAMCTELMFDHAATVESVCAVVRQLFEQAAIPVRWVAPFGSSIAGLAVEQMCDVDVCVLCSAHPVDVFAVAKQMGGAANATHRDSLLGTGQGKRLVEQATLQRAYEIMQADSRVQRVELVISAKVPILKLELGTVPVDVCVNRPAGVINSLLLRRLTEIEPRFAALARLVKAWAKRRGVINARDGFFSSYALCLLVVHYLQHCEPPLLPSGPEFLSLVEDAKGAGLGETKRSEAADRGGAHTQPAGGIDEATLRALIVHIHEENSNIGGKKAFQAVLDLLRESGVDETPPPKTVRLILADVKQSSASSTAAAASTHAEKSRESESTTGPVEPAQYMVANQDSIATLFTGFVGVHARPESISRVVTLRTHGYCSKKKWAREGNGRLAPFDRYCIEDPVAPEVDCGQNLDAECVRIFRAENGRALELLQLAAGSGSGTGCCSSLTEIFSRYEPSCSLCGRPGLREDDFSRTQLAHGDATRRCMSCVEGEAARWAAGKQAFVEVNGHDAWAAMNREEKAAYINIDI